MSANRFNGWFTPHGSAVIAVLLVILIFALPACGSRTEPRDPPRADAGSRAIPTAATATGGERPAGAVGDAVAALSADTQAAVASVAEETRESTTAVIPAMLDMQQAVQDALPPQPVDQVSPVAPVSPAAVALIVRHEIISPGYYTANLQGFACPGDTSGPTVGIGSDLGVHTPTRIASDWSIHPHVGTLMRGSGVIGFGPCRGYRSAHADVRTPFATAETVFATKVLPAYYELAARAFRNGWDKLPPNAQGALTATVFVRGAGMRDAKGSNKRAEMRELRDVCVPAADVQCIARAHRAMCARYEGRKDAGGLCKRFRETAELAVRA